MPLEELKRRDPKRIYERFFLGEIKNVAGLDVDIDLPINADFVVKNGKINDNESLANQISQILFLYKLNVGNLKMKILNIIHIYKIFII